MDEKAHGMLKLIEEGGKPFAKRVEMIEAVKESYLAFKALAERYDVLSKELQNANNIIETVFPEQVQLSMDGDDDYPMPAPKTTIKPAPTKSTKVPKGISMDSLKGFINNAFKQS
ncbi:hypothetical protein SASPL_138003 [Salvia splendens]|uniref:Uncharacterized protein n=1 Tax=Salvia splendens TaxID=180675 RepID=A0A8X8ZDH0_SALSN|nr:hypothetical protein SASPL_138003 [Salvia splendens]